MRGHRHRHMKYIFILLYFYLTRVKRVKNVICVSSTSYSVHESRLLVSFVNHHQYLYTPLVMCTSFCVCVCEGVCVCARARVCVCHSSICQRAGDVISAQHTHTHTHTHSNTLTHTFSHAPITDHKQTDIP